MANREQDSEMAVDNSETVDGVFDAYKDHSNNDEPARGNSTSEDTRSIGSETLLPIQIKPENITLYWMSGQIASWKLRIVLEEKQLHGYKSIMLVKPNENDKNDEFWTNNQQGTVPSLRVQDITLNGVLPALLFLETFLPTLLPDSPPNRKAVVLERAFESMRFQRASSQDLIAYLMSCNDSTTPLMDTDLRENREKILFRELIRWNDYLREHESINGIAHNSFTLADVLFFPELALAVRFGLSLDHFSYLDTYYETLSVRPSIRKTWPYHWLHTAAKFNWLASVDRFAMSYWQRSATNDEKMRTILDQNPEDDESQSTNDSR